MDSNMADIVNLSTSGVLYEFNASDYVTQFFYSEMNQLENATGMFGLETNASVSRIPLGNATLRRPVVRSHPIMRAPGPDCSEGMYLARYIIEVVLSFPIALVGIVGNLLAFIVLCRQRQRLTTTLLLQGLAIADTCVLISIVLGRSMRYMAICNGWDAFTAIYPVLFRWMYPLTYFFRQAGVWLITLLTIDRWIAVCRPLHAQRLCTLSRAYKQMAAVTVGAMVVTLPRFFEYDINDEGKIATHWLLRIKEYTISYRIILFFLLMYLVPLGLLTVLNTRLLRTLKEADLYRAALRESRGQHAHGCMPGFRSITWMVVFVVISCVLCNILAMVGHILWSLAQCFKHLKHLEDARRYIVLASNLMITIHSALNFGIYCLCSKSFRTSFMATFCACPTLHRRPARSQSNGFGGIGGGGGPVNKRCSGGGSGSGTGLMYFSLPQSRRKTPRSSVRGSHDLPPPATPPPQQTYRVVHANGGSNGAAAEAAAGYRSQNGVTKKMSTGLPLTENGRVQESRM